MPPPPPHSHSSRQAQTAERPTLPSFAEFVASCAPETHPPHSITQNLTLFPLQPPASAHPTLPPALVQRTHTEKHHADSAATAPPTKDPAEVRVHFCGPLVTYPMGGAAARVTPPALQPQLKAALAAHTRRLKAHGPDPELSAPSAQGIEVNLCYVDFPFSMNATAVWFRRTLKSLMPHDVGGVRHYALQWDIVCARCGEAVTHLNVDKVWNGRYLEHKRECEARRGVRDSEEGIRGQSDWRVDRGGRA